ncbi:hypothetical protein AB3662_24740 [Sorangium cellulosum]|uniref:hypothetical protein n=1 Tax=Sorangium cellulosum TaxID=56 RepID=UPI003D9A7B36
MSMRMKLMGAVTMSLSLGFAVGFALGFAGGFAGEAWGGTANVPASGAEARNFGCGAKGQNACPSIHVER